MSSRIPEKDAARALDTLQTQGRCIAIELKSLGVAYDTMVRSDDDQLMEGWEIPAISLPTNNPLMLAQEGIYPSADPRVLGREVRPLASRDVESYGAALAIRRCLFALEKKHDIFGRIRAGKGINPTKKG